MFTGLIENLGTVKAVTQSRLGLTISIDTGPLAANLRQGGSLAVDGVCLTAKAIKPPLLDFDVVGQTLCISTLLDFRPGQKVNLERPITLQSPLGGHLVSGHVDGVAKLLALQNRANDRMVRFKTQPEITRLMIPKGSVAINGVSLTVAELNDATFAVALIPTTLSATNLGLLKPGQNVNVETDLVGKYIAKFLADRPGQPLSKEILQEHGFA